LKGRRYDFSKPRAKSEEGCIAKGQMAMIGANLNKMVRDIVQVSGMEMEIG
jgi:hypothetical protein